LNDEQNRLEGSIEVTSMSKEFPDQFSPIQTAFHEEIKTILQQARNKTYQAINTAMIEAYWLIGKRIVEVEQDGKQQAAYGKRVLEGLSQALTAEFGKGFSYSNLRNFRQFYQTYPDWENCYALRSKLTWTHHRLIMRVDNPEARDFYVKECEAQGWSTRALERNIQTFYYQRILSNKEKSIVPEKDGGKHDPKDFVKDPYVFEFLNFPEPFSASEKELEGALLTHLQEFLLELGKGFSFVGRQFRISTETDHFYIDLVFYNYLLKCFVLIDLKTRKLMHQDIGQMDMYRRMFDDLKKPEGDNPTIGILLCTDKSETVVKYSVMQDSQQLFAAKFMPFLPTEEELIAEIERDKALIEGKGDEEN
jgi:predicted nuclease of restriction endonuclease-like (RecB) superfamily